MRKKDRLTPGQLLSQRSRLGRDPASAGEGWRALSALYTEIASRRSQRLSTACVVAPDATGGIAPGLWDSRDDCIRIDGKYLPLPPDELDPQGNFAHHKALSAIHGLFAHECGHAVHSLQEKPDEKMTAKLWEVMMLLEEIRMEAHTVAERPADAAFIRAAVHHIMLDDQKFVLGAMTRVSACAQAATLIEGRVVAGSLQPQDAAPITQIADALIPEPMRSDLRQLWQDVIKITDDDLAGLEKAALRFLEMLPEEKSSMMIIANCNCDCHSKGDKQKGQEKQEAGEQKDKCDCHCHNEGKKQDNKENPEPGKDGEYTPDPNAESADSPDLPIPPPAPEGEEEDDPDAPHKSGCGANHSKVGGGQGSCDAETGPDDGDNTGATGKGPGQGDNSETGDNTTGKSGGKAAGEAQSQEDGSDDSGTCSDCGCSKGQGDQSEGGDQGEGQGQGEGSGEGQGDQSEGGDQGEGQGQGEGDCSNCNCAANQSGGSGSGGGSGDGGGLTEEEIQDILDAIEEATTNAAEAGAQDTASADAIQQIEEEIREGVEVAKKIEEVQEARNQVSGKTAGQPGGSAIKAARRPPNPQERVERNKLAALLKRARWRDRVSWRITTEIPPGKLRSRAAMQRSAQISNGRIPTAQPWSQTKRKHVEMPNLKASVLVDTSGSMYGTTKVMSSSLWVIANAIADVQGRCAAYAFGDSCARIIDPIKPPDRVFELCATGGTDYVYEALQASDDALFFNLDRTGQRIVFIISDGYWFSTSKALKKMEEMHKTGVRFIHIMVHEMPVDQGCDEICVINDIKELTKVVGNACIKALKQGQ